MMQTSRFPGFMSTRCITDRCSRCIARVRAPAQEAFLAEVPVGNIPFMRFHLVTLLLVVGAVVCYFVGFGEGIIPLMAAYLILELTIGIRLHRRRRKRLETEKQGAAAG
ncbi:MAG: hypothetical protein JXB36_13020 [Gammaproteobacteria bacterium]|nr:hypothetical protein [Gammaproteobacteria bacterium]